MTPDSNSPERWQDRLARIAGAAGPAGTVRLIIDPIDATRNFVSGIPLFATLLAIEAGARATSVAGERTIYAGSFVTLNGLLHDAALALLGQHVNDD